MSTANIFDGSLSCSSFACSGSAGVTGVLIASGGFVGPFIRPAAVTSGDGTAFTASAGTGANATVTGGNGGAASFVAGNGGDGGTTGGTGATASVVAGNAGAGGNANGGHVNLVPGTKTGTGLAGEVRVNSSNAGFIPVSMVYVPSSVDVPFFVASRAYRIRSVIWRVEVAGTDGGAVSGAIKKAPSGTAIAAGVAVTSASADLKGVAATNQVLALSGTAANLELAAGDCLGVDFTGVLTSATGAVTVTLAPL